MVDGTIEGTAYKGSGMREGTNSSDDFEVLSQSTGYLYANAPWKGHGSAVFLGLRCPKCKHEFKPYGLRFTCPKCRYKKNYEKVQE